MTPQPMIAVRSVAVSRSWYAHVLGLQSAHGGDEYERMMDGDQLVLQLHHWEVHEHPYLGDPAAPVGNGVLLWFQTECFESVVSAVQMHQAKTLEGPQVNPNANHREIWLCDPDGYTVVVAGPPGNV